jgi:hypothetical protein
MSAAEEHIDHELVLAQAPAARSGGTFAGSLPHLADVSWEDFERASDLAQRDLLDRLAGALTTREDEDDVSAAPGPDFGSGD